MKVTAFLHSDSSEPCVVDLDIDSGLGEDGEEYTLREVISDVLGSQSAEDIYVVSENSIEIALHALHGVLKATQGAESGPALLARQWALAGLRDLAFYDVDGIETEDDPDDSTVIAIASDPGREAVDKVRGGTRLTTGTDFYVDWPEP